MEKTLEEVYWAINPKVYMGVKIYTLMQFVMPVKVDNSYVVDAIFGTVGKIEEEGECMERNGSERS